MADPSFLVANTEGGERGVRLHITQKGGEGEEGRGLHITQNGGREGGGLHITQKFLDKSDHAVSPNIAVKASNLSSCKLGVYNQLDITAWRQCFTSHYCMGPSAVT